MSEVLPEGPEELFLPGAHDQLYHRQCRLHGLGDQLQHTLQDVPTLRGEHVSAFGLRCLFYF